MDEGRIWIQFFNEGGGMDLGGFYARHIPREGDFVKDDTHWGPRRVEKVVWDRDRDGFSKVRVYLERPRD